MRRDLTKGLRQATVPAVRSAKAAALALPSHGGSRTGLRRRIAAATSAQVRAGGRNPGVKVRVARARLGEQAPLPRLLDQASWRHPVYGRGVWVTQAGSPRWFERANQAQAPAVRRQVKAVLDDVEKRLARH